MPETDVLLLSELAPWPLDHGGRLRVYHLALNLHQQGLRIRVASPGPLPNDAPDAIHQLTLPWPSKPDPPTTQTFLKNWQGPLAPLRHRLARHQGINSDTYAHALTLSRQHNPAAVIAVGQHAPMMLRGLPTDLTRIWYAADDVVAFLLSCMRREPLSRWPSRLYSTALHTALETAFGQLDGIVGVSNTDQRFLNTLGRPRIGRVIPNGVDLTEFNPPTPPTNPEPQTLVFWGRLDFEPNIDGLRWFAREAWPTLHRRNPNARWRIIGRGNHPSLAPLKTTPGIDWLGAVDDIKPHAHNAAVTILPMRCGGGIKNKLLEALALGRPVVCTPRALTGLPTDHRMPPVRLGSTAKQLTQAIEQLWQHPATANRLGNSARTWATRHAGWDRTAHSFIQLINDCTPTNHQLTQTSLHTRTQAA
ncbi:glycosyltransferase family 4 protein [Mucisphaera sp.]|uniref:glycosyltransferase family 4 protein n=1 Tax=Mucisphaera sp. TaxID=2913024 RepID=UPI003D0E219E